MRKFVPLVILFFIAIGTGWFLLRPLPKHHEHRTTIVERTAPPQESAPPVATPAETTTPSETSTPRPTATPLATHPANGKTAKLALIVDDCGQWVPVERGFIALPVPVTLSVLPHVHASSEIASEAASAGKGVMLHLPMDTMSGMDPGAGKVTTTMTDDEIKAQVEDDLAQVPLAKGVNNHEGSKGSADDRVMKDVISVLAQRGLFFIDSRTNAQSVGESIAHNEGVATARRNVFLDNKEDVAYSEEQLRDAAAIALRDGSAIAIGHPRATTLAAVRALIPQFQSEGIEFVLAEDLAR